jgi:hypothetical protein
MTKHDYSFETISVMYGNRRQAVEAALELIRARGLGGAGVPLSAEMNNLTKYADQILKALGQAPKAATD